MASPDFRNTNSLWCSVLVETLARLGLRQAVISPGSRSAPLTFALARHDQIEAIPLLDERSAAFFALGLAKQKHQPVALVCTSGTAAANFLPAIVEAHESGVPLLVLTADRPPELRDCGSGQTIDQQKLYGSYVNFYHELAVPEAKLPTLRYLRQTMAHAWAQVRDGGPVHLNCPFRDPLPPVEDGSTAALKDKIDEAFFEHLAGVTTVPVAATEVPLLPKAKRGLIVVGPVEPSDPAKFTVLLELLAHKTGWPVLANALSPLRNYEAPGQPFVHAYDLLARSEKLQRQLRPDFVLSVGGWPTSKPLRAWLEKADAATWLLPMAGMPANIDALHGRTRMIDIGLESFVMAQPDRGQGQYSTKLTGADALVRGELDAALKPLQWNFEGKASWLLPTLLPNDTPVFVANSMPVRDVEYFWPPNERGAAMFFNRGANGIDGTLSTALGVAHGSGRPAVLLTGDLALLHDTNGFLALPKFKGSLTIVLVNNDGGGIFEHLPVAKFNPPFEEFFATPQSVDFRKLGATYGATHTLVKDWPHFARMVAKLPKSGVRVLELRTDRKRDAAFRQKLFAKIAAGAGRFDF